MANGELSLLSFRSDESSCESPFQVSLLMKLRRLGFTEDVTERVLGVLPFPQAPTGDQFLGT
jgi:hypothetical protein